MGSVAQKWSSIHNVKPITNISPFKRVPFVCGACYGVPPHPLSLSISGSHKVILMNRTGRVENRPWVFDKGVMCSFVYVWHSLLS